MREKLYIDRMVVFAIHVLMLIASGTRRLNPDLYPVDASEHVRYNLALLLSASAHVGNQIHSLARGNSASVTRVIV